MLDYDDFDFQEHMEEERELNHQPKPSPQGNGAVTSNFESTFFGKVKSTP